MNSPEAPKLRRMNELKRTLSVDFLTDAQQEAMKEIMDHRSDNARFINLYGGKEVGKTYLSWVLQKTEEWKYYPQLPESAENPVVIYDHADPDRMATRNLRNHASINGIATVLYVTNKPAVEVFPRVELDPSDDHYETIKSNWESLELPTGKRSRN